MMPFKRAALVASGRVGDRSYGSVKVIFWIFVVIGLAIWKFKLRLALFRR